MKFIKGDCIEEMRKLKGQFDLILTDPPYNIDWDYGEEVNDKIEDYHQWCEDWAFECMKLLKSNGVFLIINYPENNNVLFNYLNKHYTVKEQLIWKYNTNIGMSNKKYTRSYRTILVVTKGPETTFNPTLQSYKNPFDPRVREQMKSGAGVTHYDVFHYELCKNVSKDKKNIGINQLPNDLVDMLIRTYSNPGDTVLDPFVGNGTTVLRSEHLGREGTGIDIVDRNWVRKEERWW